jgi:hypothetical protein
MLKLEQLRTKLLSLACFAILGGILVAGLWPFHAPRNQVHWLLNNRGLWFGRHGTALSATEFKAQNASGSKACTVEIGLAPAITWDRRTILAFYATNHTIPFSLHQLERDLLIERHLGGLNRQIGAEKLCVGGVFRRDRAALIDITSNGRETVVYVNGLRAAESSEFAFSSKDLAGELVLANSPVMDDSWSGVMKELAIYNLFLTQQAALLRYQSWAETGSPAPALGGRPVALYFFHVAAGRVIRNQAAEGPDLYIPRQFTVPDQIFLERPWSEYQSELSYWKNVFINIVGFVPLGFFFFPYFSLVHRSRRSAMMTLLLGAAVSVTIEVLQAYLPTRFSGMTDVFTNTLGTAAGVGVYGCIRIVCEPLSGSRTPAVREIALLMWPQMREKAALSN